MESTSRMCRTCNDECVARAIEPDEDDADALSWAGDEELGRHAPRLAGDVEEASPVEPVEADAPAPTPRNRPLAVATALFGIVYLALTVGWIFSVQLLSAPGTDVPTEVAWQFGEFTAIIAAPLWFGAAVNLTRGGRARVRLGWLLLGVGVLVPWPILLAAAA